MKIGFLGYEYFAERGKNTPTNSHGGFGYLTRKKCEYLARMGHEVHVFVPRPSYDGTNGGNINLEINKVQLHLYNTSNFFEKSGTKRIFSQMKEMAFGMKSLQQFLREFPMDVYQSEEPYMFTEEALKLSDRQVVVFQDPLDDDDIDSMNKSLGEFIQLDPIIHSSILYKNSRRFLGKFGSHINAKLFVRTSVKRVLDHLDQKKIYSEAKFISLKVKQMYDLDYIPGILPNPVEIPKNFIKSDKPLVIWLNRWDPVKRPQTALEVAKNIPDATFHFIGKSTGYPLYERIEDNLRAKYSKFKNIKMSEFISEEEKDFLLGKAWVLLNTSAREGLPVTFLEAGAYGVPIISTVNPDNYSTEFGEYVPDLTNIVPALKRAIKEEWFKTKGKKAREYMSQAHEVGIVMKKHLKIYEDIAGSNI